MTVPTNDRKTANINVRNLNNLKLGVWTIWWTQTTKSAKIKKLKAQTLCI